MRRLEDWPMRLDQVLREAAGRPFEWGAHDCAAFAAGAVEAMTGKAPGKSLRRYRTARGAAAVVARAGCLEAVLNRALKGCETIAPAFAQRGDVVLFDGPEGETIGICVGRLIASPAPTGLGYTPMSAARRAWRI